MTIFQIFPMAHNQKQILLTQIPTKFIYQYAIVEIKTTQMRINKLFILVRACQSKGFNHYRLEMAETQKKAEVWKALQQEKESVRYALIGGDWRWEAGGRLTRRRYIMGRAQGNIFCFVWLVQSGKLGEKLGIWQSLTKPSLLWAVCCRSSGLASPAG